MPLPERHDGWDAVDSLAAFRDVFIECAEKCHAKDVPSAGGGGVARTREPTGLDRSAHWDQRVSGAGLRGCRTSDRPRTVVISGGPKAVQLDGKVVGNGAVVVEAAARTAAGQDPGRIILDVQDDSFYPRGPGARVRRQLHREGQPDPDDRHRRRIPTPAATDDHTRPTASDRLQGGQGTQSERT